MIMHWKLWCGVPSLAIGVLTTYLALTFRLPNVYLVILGLMIGVTGLYTLLVHFCGKPGAQLTFVVLSGFAPALQGIVNYREGHSIRGTGLLLLSLALVVSGMRGLLKRIRGISQPELE